MAGSMRITEIRPYPIWVGHRNQLVVKVETDEGVYGLGESEDFGCAMAADFDGNNRIVRTDAIRLLHYLFRARGMPASPFPDCGVELSTLGCDRTTCVGGVSPVGVD